MTVSRLLCIALLLVPVAWSQGRLEIRLPERTRLLQDQRVDIVVEAKNLPGAKNFKVTANGVDITARFSGPKTVDLDCDTTPDQVWRADLMSFPEAGRVRLMATVDAATGITEAVKDITVQPMALAGKGKNIILYIGDAMAEAYRDAGRLVSRSVEARPGVSKLREGFFDELMEMDRMPVSGVIMTLGADRVIPDSANSASALATGNKTFEGAMGVFADGTDCQWYPAVTKAELLPAALDNPRIETIAEYLKRKFGYRVGLVTTDVVAGATPAAFTAHTAERDAAFEIIRQYLENPMLGGKPVADVILGGGRESFEPEIRADKRNMIAEFEAAGYKLVSNAAELKAVTASTQHLLGLFKRPATVSTHSSGIRPSSSGVMDVAYDKLRLRRPGSEPNPSFGVWTDQPMLDLMTRKAIEILSAGDKPFFLMVEGASIDKQSHSNHAAGTIWDVIELDKAVGVGRQWAAARPSPDTLLLVTADHGQTMSILGVTYISDADYFDRTNRLSLSLRSPVGTHSATVYRDVNANVRANVPWANSGSGNGPPAEYYDDIYGNTGFPNYIDADGDGYPENQEHQGRGRVRLSVGFRTGSHSGLSLPLTAEGPGALLFTGYMDQADVPLKIAAAVATDTSEMDAVLLKILTNPRFPKTPGK